MSIISASTTTTTALQYTADTTGTLVFKTGATPTTALTIGADQSATFAGTVNFAAAGFTNLSYTGTLTGGTGVVNIGSGQLYKDSSGNVGLGTTSPANRLHIVSDNTAFRGQISLQTINPNNAAQITFYDKINLSAQIYQDYSNGGLLGFVNSVAAPMTFWTTNTERMRIDASGNVGIGTTSPGFKADIRIASAGTIANFSDGTQNLTIGTTASLSFVNGQGGVLGLYTSGTERMRINSSGQVMIGTTTALGSVTVNNAIWTVGSSGAFALTRRDTNAYVGSWYSASGAFQLDMAGVGEAMRIDSSGNMSVGTTTSVTKLTLQGVSTASAVTNYANLGGLTIAGSIANTSVTGIGFSSGGGGGAGIGLGRGGSEDTFLTFYTNPTGTGPAGAMTERMRITGIGRVGIGTSSPGFNLDVQYAGATIIQSKNTFNAGDAQFRAENTGGITLLGRDSSGTYIWENGVFPIQFFTSATERVRIDSSGTLFVGTTSTPNSVPSKLTVSGQTFLSTPNIAISSSTWTTIATMNAGLATIRDQSNGGACLVLFDANGGTTLAIISQVGSTTSYTLSAPSAAQIQLRQSGAAIQVLGGSSRNGSQVSASVIAIA